MSRFLSSNRTFPASNPKSQSISSPAFAFIPLKLEQERINLKSQFVTSRGGESVFFRSPGPDPGSSPLKQADPPYIWGLVHINNIKIDVELLWNLI